MFAHVIFFHLFNNFLFFWTLHYRCTNCIMKMEIGPPMCMLSKKEWLGGQRFPICGVWMCSPWHQPLVTLDETSLEDSFFFGQLMQPYKRNLKYGYYFPFLFLVLKICGRCCPIFSSGYIQHRYDDIIIWDHAWDKIHHPAWVLQFGPFNHKLALN